MKIRTLKEWLERSLKHLTPLVKYPSSHVGILVVDATVSVKLPNGKHEHVRLNGIIRHYAYKGKDALYLNYELGLTRKDFMQHLSDTDDTDNVPDDYDEIIAEVGSELADYLAEGGAHIIEFTGDGSIIFRPPSIMGEPPFPLEGSISTMIANAIITGAKLSKEAEDKLMGEIAILYSRLSPENLSMDGELSRSETQKRYVQLNKQLKGLFAKLGRNVSEDEIYDWADKTKFWQRH